MKTVNFKTNKMRNTESLGQLQLERQLGLRFQFISVALYTPYGDEKYDKADLISPPATPLNFTSRNHKTLPGLNF